MLSIIKSLDSRQPGRSISNRYQVKTFKTLDTMHKFLQTSDNALHWKQTETPMKAGTYFSRIERVNGENQVVYLNVKLLNG